MAQPDINSILAALAQQHANGAGSVSTHQQSTPAQGPPSYPPGGMSAQSPSVPQGGGFLPQPSSTGSLDLSGIKPVSSGSVSIADAIAKARNIAADRGVASHDPRQNSATPRDDPRRNFRSRSRSPRRDSYGGNPYRDERREDPARGRHRRSPSDDRSFRGSRDPPANNRGGGGGSGGNEGETETITVKSTFVGLVIGRGGDNMRKIESESGARVQFIQAKDSRVAERMCTITGSLRARMAAKEAIFGIIRENDGSDDLPDQGGYGGGMSGRGKSGQPAVREGENSTQLMVPDKTVGLIIGRGGETIKDLQEKSGCHINILPENKSVNGLRPVNLIGSDRATQTAKDMIYEIVESDTRSSQANGGGSGGRASGSGSNSTMPQRDRGYDTYNNNSGGGGGGGYGGDPGQVKKTIDVPSEAVGMIIGKGGETIKELQKSSGCSINVNQPQRPDITRKIDLAGPAHAVREAEHTIWEKVETVRQRDAQRGGGPHQGGGGGRDYQQQPHQQQYDPYSQQTQQQPAAMPSYAQYLPGAGLQTQQQAAPQMPTFQMPSQSPAPGTQQQQQQQAGDPAQNEQYAAAWAQYYAQHFAQLQQQQQNGGGAPGT